MKHSLKKTERSARYFDKYQYLFNEISVDPIYFIINDLEMEEKNENKDKILDLIDELRNRIIILAEKKSANHPKNNNGRREYI